MAMIGQQLWLKISLQCVTGQTDAKKCIAFYRPRGPKRREKKIQLNRRKKKV